MYQHRKMALLQHSHELQEPLFQQPLQELARMVTGVALHHSAELLLERSLVMLQMLLERSLAMLQKSWTRYRPSPAPPKQ